MTGVSSEGKAALWSPHRLHLTLFATDLCNLRCTYCYEDHVGSHMRSEVVDGVIALLNRRAPTLQPLVPSGFGGEPLLALVTLEQVISDAKPLAVDRHFVCMGTVTTNAATLCL